MLPSELTDAIQEVFDKILDDAACVPPLWRLEVANSLSASVRRRRITITDRDMQLEDLLDLPIVEDADGSGFVWSSTLRLSDKHRLTIYDAVYLELSLRRSLPLASLDYDLRKAASAENVPVLGL